MIETPPAYDSAPENTDETVRWKSSYAEKENSSDTHCTTHSIVSYCRRLTGAPGSSCRENTTWIQGCSTLEWKQPREGREVLATVTQPCTPSHHTHSTAKSAFTFLGPETDCSRAGRMREDAQSGSCSPRTARSQGFPSRQWFSSCQAVRPRQHRQTILHVFIKHGDKWLRRYLRAFFFTVRFLRTSFSDLSQSRGFTYPPYTDDG